jgi:hypothetical protein
MAPNHCSFNITNATVMATRYAKYSIGRRLRILKIKSVLYELKEKRFFALERTPGRPTRILQELLQDLGCANLKYSFLQPHSINVGNSLSGKYGFGDFPLHTDGAHLSEPPDYILLMAPRTRVTPTLVADPSDIIDLRSECAKQAIFSVQRRGRTFNSQFVGSKKGVSFIRYNSDTMKPKNSAAQDIWSRMQGLHKYAFQLHWDKYALLVLDNRLMLHGRGQVKGTMSHMRRIEVRL